MALHQRKTAKRTAPAPLQPRDWLGRGGLMGFPGLAFPSRLAGLALRARVYVLSAVWLSAATLYFLWQLPLLLLLLIPDDGTIYKRTCTSCAACGYDFLDGRQGSACLGTLWSETAT